MFDKALYYFEACVTVPTFAVSHIMMEAYNKYLLVSLIVNGDKPKEASALPKYTRFVHQLIGSMQQKGFLMWKCVLFSSAVVSKYIRPLSSAYHDLVNGFYTNQTSELEVGSCFF